ncbi:hypothetical protein WJX81_000485 [Elliptochloris bilobata]|uniref:Agmatine deiminase n=2 Tax=Elliptochloris bilobata TaxID=381761 RepID=A0AAW1S0B7_9CHLO
MALSWCDDVNDPQYERSTDAYERLTNATDAKGRKIEGVKVPCPPPLFRTYKEASGVHPDHVKLGYVRHVDSERLPASYINHYIANGGAVIPQFGGPGLERATETDAKALEVLQAAYGPERKVVGVKLPEILLNAGNIHCITQQQPAARVCGVRSLAYLQQRVRLLSRVHELG